MYGILRTQSALSECIIKEIEISLKFLQLILQLFLLFLLVLGLEGGEHKRHYDQHHNEHNPESDYDPVAEDVALHKEMDRLSLCACLFIFLGCEECE